MSIVKRIVIVGLVCILIAQTLAWVHPAQAAPPASACSGITLENPHSDACNAEIAANPAPNLERPVALDTKTQGLSKPRSVLLPKDPLPYPIGWLLKDWYYSDAPGAEPPAYTKDREVPKAKVVFLYATVNVKTMDWHMIGPDQWISGEYVAALKMPTRPDKVSGHWIALDLTEQTIMALDNDTPLFATLVSAAWSGYGVTREGLFHIYARTKSTIFRGPPWAKVPEYILDHVPDVMFFDGNIGLHGAYWHDFFGFQRTHGCVNIPVGDAHWLWNWVSETADQWGPDKGAFHLPHPDKAPWVYVYHSPRTGDTRSFPS